MIHVKLSDVHVVVTGLSVSHAEQCMVAAVEAGATAQPIGTSNRPGELVEVHLTWSYDIDGRAAERLGALVEFIRRVES